MKANIYLKNPITGLFFSTSGHGFHARSIEYATQLTPVEAAFVEAQFWNCVRVEPSVAIRDQFSTSAAQVAAMTDDELVRQSWGILTNNRQSGGGSVKGRRLAQRRIRELGYRFFLGGWFASEGIGSGSCWGMLRPGDRPDSTLDWVEVGVSLNHCAHKLGAGNATEGWRIYWAR